MVIYEECLVKYHSPEWYNMPPDWFTWSVDDNNIALMKKPVQVRPQNNFIGSLVFDIMRELNSN